MPLNCMQVLYMCAVGGYGGCSETRNHDESPFSVALGQVEEQDSDTWPLSIVNKLSASNQKQTSGQLVNHRSQNIYFIYVPLVFSDS